MPKPTLPLIVLAGSDERPAELPETGADKHPLVGSKGIDLKIAGRPLIDLALERLFEAESFRPIYIAGPTRLYGEARGEATVIDTDGTFGENIECALTRAVELHPDSPIAFTTCDILLQREELRRLTQACHADAPFDFWFPLIRVPPDPRTLGASAWKPRYRIVPRPGEQADSLLPGHLVVIDPEALRLDLVFHTFQLAYSSRNRPVLYRLWLMVRSVFIGLVREDIRHLLRLRAPTMTFEVLANGIAMGRRLHRGVITREELEDRLRKIFIRRSHRRRYPDRRGLVPFVDTLSLAKDIDTEEEAAERARDLA